MHRALTTDQTAALSADLVAAVASHGQTNQHRLGCPSCGGVPNGKVAAARLREELQTDWWSTTDQDPARVVVTRHCGQCQPHTVYAVACLACGDGPLLAGELAELADSGPQQLPTIVTSELTRTGWRWIASPHATGRVCCQPTSQPTVGQRS